MNRTMRGKIEQLRDLVWSFDIPHPTIPEYVEHHKQIQEILKFIDGELINQEPEKGILSIIEGDVKLLGMYRDDNYFRTSIDHLINFNDPSPEKASVYIIGSLCETIKSLTDRLINIIEKGSK